jgi:hypothetical protein
MNLVMLQVTNNLEVVSVYFAHSLSTETLLIWVSVVLYIVHRRGFKIDYLCALFVGDEVKNRPLHIIQ